jgi:RimJ/RimL family protein N-acetyltransferase
VIQVLETERLLLRPFDQADLGDLVRLHGEESFWWYPLRRGMTPEETEGFLDRTLADCRDPERPAFHAVVERSGGALIGWAGLSVPDFLPEVLPAVEIGWRLGTAHRGLGYATEAGSAALRWGFDDLGLDAILSIFEPQNIASGRVMDHLGFDAGVRTTHPRGLPLVVRTLTAIRWARAGADGADDLPSGANPAANSHPLSAPGGRRDPRPGGEDPWPE